MDTARAVLLYSFLLVLFVATGCSSMPWTSSSGEVSEVTGTYQVRQLEFAPEASVLESINVLHYLEGEELELELTESEDFVLSYRTENGKQVTVTGTYTVKSKKVELNGQRGDVQRYEQILLDRSFYLLRNDPKVLWVETKKSVAPMHLSSSYKGLTGVEGVLRLKFVRQ